MSNERRNIMHPFYEPKGAAREYAPLALNLYNGCSHGCTYCYAPACVHRSRDDFRTNVTPRKGIIEALQKSLKREVPKQTVLLSFTSDPYQRLEAEAKITRAALETMDGLGMDVAILTKSTRVERDFNLIAKNGWHLGMTLSCWEPEFAEEYEFFVSLPHYRYETLRDSEEIGIKTFVSIEPVLNEKELALIFDAITPLRLESGVRIGKWNHSPEADKIDWKRVLDMSLDFAVRTGHKVYIKDALTEYGDVPQHLRVRPFG